MEGIKVVSTDEMARIEKGGDHEAYMEMAGRRVAEAVIAYIERHELPKQVTLLIGKGNNGGDAYAAGLWLIDEGYQVRAFAPFDQKSDLNQKFRAKFQKKRGSFTEALEGVLIDGLLGTGFKGKLDPKMNELIKEANESELPIIAIDIPSGLNGTSGEVGVRAIIASETVALGMAKIGFFIHQGWNYVGKIHVADFGLPDEKIAAAEAIAYLPQKLELPKMLRVRHKYEAGYVVGYAGSKDFVGAAKMAGYAALKAGAGIVRIFHKDEIGQAPLELICSRWNAKDWILALKKANAVFVGPGLGNSQKWLQKHLQEIKQPCVIDADALQCGIEYPEMAVLTPHRGEMLRLLGLKKALKDEDLFSKVIRFCNQKKLYVILKGAPTFVFGPNHKPVIIPRGDPGMASAGMGDVLTGIVVALLAEGCGPYESAILGAALHAIAGELAAEELTSYSVTASDLFTYLPDAFQFFVERHDIV